MALRMRVCRRDEVAPGELRAFDVHGATWPVIVTIVDGELIAFPGVCPHDDVPLTEYGKLVGHTLTCRVHGYQFDVIDGRCQHLPSLQLRRYRITLQDEDVWIDML